MKKSIVILIAILISMGSHARRISEDQAQIAAKNFMTGRAAWNASTSEFSAMVKNCTMITADGHIAMYAINFKEGGFALVTADDKLVPVVGYSFKGSFDPADLPEQLRFWIDLYKAEIIHNINNEVVVDPANQLSWERLLSDKPEPEPKGRDVSPFLPCNWDQGKYYNELCPASSGGDGGHVWVGCVATAMAQVMFYYRYPNQGQGSHSYNHNTFGTQSANFGATTYPWDGMLNQLTTNNLPVALISYHAGVAVDMDYGPDGSGAQTSSVAGALKNYFRYNDSAHFTKAMYYSAADWAAMIRSDLDKKRPVIYSGSPTSGGAGHCWVVDGYQGSSHFHMNWGWSGASNGYFYVSNLNPPAGGGNFNGDQSAVMHIFPESGFPYSCTGQKVITHTTGTLEDGSWAELYQPNLNCSWLIRPDDSVNAIKLNFHRFETEASNDILNIYGGDNPGAPLLGSFSGSTLPPQITHNGNALLITFSSDGNNNHNGWYLTYSSVLPEYCSNENLNTPTGTITDGSGPRNYQPNTTCTWIINPPNAVGLKLTFTSFETQAGSDVLKIYDMTTQELLASCSGNTLPPPVMAPSGAMYIEWRTNGSQQYQGWEANYATLGIGIEEEGFVRNLAIYPNPASSVLHLRAETIESQKLKFQVTAPDGRIVREASPAVNSNAVDTQFDLTGLAQGIYFLRVLGEKGTATRRFIIQ